MLNTEVILDGAHLILTFKFENFSQQIKILRGIVYVIHM